MFWEGFQKRAYDYGNTHGPQHENPLPQSPDAPQKSSWKHPLVAAGGALAAGAGMYAALRKPWMKTPTLHRFVERVNKKKPGLFRRILDRASQGADEVHYIHPKAAPPARPKKLKGITAGTSEEMKFFKGDRTIGDIKHPALKKIVDDKAHEAKFIKKHAPEYAIETHILDDVKHQGVDGLKGIHKKFPGRKYFIKPRSGYSSGVGGGAFINSKDVEKFLSTGEVDESKRSAMNTLLKKPSEFVLQPDIHIQKSPITGASSEFRVHSLAGNVVKGTGGTRSVNVEDMFKVRKAEQHMQKFLDKLPKHLKEKDMMFSADVALTPEGYKIIELNPGGLESGLLEPNFLWKKYHEPASVLWAARGNQKLYRHIQGRSHPVSAAAGAVATAGGAYGAGRYLQHKLDQKPSDKEGHS